MFRIRKTGGQAGSGRPYHIGSSGCDWRHWQQQAHHVLRWANDGSRSRGWPIRPSCNKYMEIQGYQPELHVARRGDTRHYARTSLPASSSLRESHPNAIPLQGKLVESNPTFG
ncbi:hypothetical protein VTN96DRAFT_6980 [Rasamsonia emersonii]